MGRLRKRYYCKVLLWEDLEKGIIAKPGVNKVVLEKYKRPGLTTHIPVNDLGQLLSPLDSGYAKNYVNGLTLREIVEIARLDY